MRLFVLAAMIALLGAAAPATLDVRIHDGAMTGTVAGNIAAFRGIPYAAPPVGDLRWKPPAPPAPWSGVLDASKFGNQCPQYRVSKTFSVSVATEDCLFLNVYTSPNAVKKHGHLPVLFWPHGGGFSAGSGDMFSMPSMQWMNDAGVIVVTSNYRLGVLGFLALPALDAEPHDNGDYGIMDEQAALRWTKDNIAAFGGDPNNITIGGISTGAGVVDALLVSPEVKGLFNRAIIMSGSTQAIKQRVIPQADAQKTGAAFAKAAGCAVDDLACLRALLPDKIVKMQAPYLVGLSAIIGNVATFPAKGFQSAFETGKFNHVPIMLGFDRDDNRWKVGFTELTVGHPLTDAGYLSAIADYFTEYTGASSAPSIAAKYPPSHFPNPSEALGAAETDYYMACTAYSMDHWFAPFATVYTYRFDDESLTYMLPKVSFPYGASHGIDGQMLFPDDKHPLTPAQRKLSEAMVGYWTAFIKTGNPNGGGRPVWPSFTATRAFMSMREPAPMPFSAAAFDKLHQCDYWNTLTQY